MRHSLFITCWAICGLVIACNPSPQPPSAPTAPQADSPVTAVALPPRTVGQVVAAEAIAGAADASYAYYLPPQYSPDRPIATIIFFDSHARGKDPVTLYQGLADQYGILLLGSNVSKNGQGSQQGPLLYDQLIADAKTKFAIDPQRIVTAGFSGGARVAATVAQTRQGIAAVIGCAAGLTPDPNAHWSYFGIVGLEDFNFWEMDQVDRQLDGTGQPHVVRWFAGGHAWPPVDVMDEAFAFVTLRTMGSTDARRDSMAQAYRDRHARADAKLHGRGSAHGQYRLQKALVAALDGLGDLGAERAQLDQMAASPAVTEAAAAMRKAMQAEFELRNVYVGHLGTKSVAEWRTLAGDLRAGRVAYEGRDHFSDLRILNFVSLNVYFNVDGALKAGDLVAADRFVQIYALVDPPNAEHAYLTAVLRARQNRLPEVLPALRQAQSLGFKDADRLAAEADFAPLRSDQQFAQLLADLRAL